MLKNISNKISPDLLKTLAEMGHGDTIVLGDCNFPSTSVGKRCLRADGVSASALLEAIMRLLPLDVNEPEPQVILMKSTDHPDYVPEIWGEFKKVIEKFEPKAKFCAVERNEFYEKSRNAFACVQTSEEKSFGCIILRKGIWHTENEEG
ncbi:hypothetical protein BXO88_06160 [Oribacterium sp. C9]|uniref:RbsD/FucU family protein n=1 Tax=Oribacterium sp. C9 TaxID=1943579 RepID=UPI00098E9E33|nr:RbsD/FucU domain-containing protein [Oribacterium sp. C9]OON86842.1 hypothetical protein BXO88_06160 [Oribacterium sp. C9]